MDGDRFFSWCGWKWFKMSTTKRNFCKVIYMCGCTEFTVAVSFSLANFWLNATRIAPLLLSPFHPFEHKKGSDQSVWQQCCCSTDQIIIEVLEEFSFTFQPAASSHLLTGISCLSVLQCQDIVASKEPHLHPYRLIVTKHIGTLVKRSRTESLE